MENVKSFSDSELTSQLQTLLKEAESRGLVLDLGLFMLEDVVSNLEISEEEAKEFAKKMNNTKDYSSEFAQMSDLYTYM